MTANLCFPPPSYAVADNSYRSLRTERKDQCILISGESGAGKTEASKKILQYYAVTCPASEQVQTVKDRLLQSNPVLEVSGTRVRLRDELQETNAADYAGASSASYPKREAASHGRLKRSDDSQMFSRSAVRIRKIAPSRAELISSVTSFFGLSGGGRSSDFSANKCPASLEGLKSS